ncbi:DMT family transporter [Halobacillus amylolyticus]|uniref:DMT family transporter n=1 Tax=Halobacillus amylolyticus TaxID=2932259 RepID=A0ABY4HAS6_9BACI|nr:DMT family transporter [Halobacillus amylolyticus]
MLPFLFWFDFSWLGSMKGVTVSLHLGILTIAVAYYLFVKGLKFVPSSQPLPLLWRSLGVFLVGERLSGVSWIGIGLLLFGIIVLTLNTNQRGIKKAER